MDDANGRADAPIVPVWVRDAALVTVVATVFLYVVGWSYNLGFYTFFGIDPDLFDDGLAETLTTAFRVLIWSNYSLWYNILLFVLWVAAFAILPRLTRKSLGYTSAEDARLTRIVLRMSALPVGFMVLALLSMLCRDLGKRSAHQVAHRRESLMGGAHPVVRVRYAAAASLSPAMVLIKASGQYVVLHGGEGVMIVPREQIAAILVE